MHLLVEFSIVDNPNNLLIVPEMFTGHLFNYKKIRKAIWWLSIDNFYKTTFKNKIGRLFGIIKNFNLKEAHNYFHFAQSKYAYEYLKSNSRLDSDKLFMLSDYLLEDFLKIERNELSDKEDIVLYNPKKGIDFTQKIIDKSNNDFKWIAIENMTPNQVRKNLMNSKLYIDFGKHPGKDRFPREAVICGCCIITGKMGSAGFFEDVPIPDEFKFSNSEAEIDKIIEKIKAVFNDYENEQLKFNYYIQQIKSQETIFENEITKIFKTEIKKDN